MKSEYLQAALRTCCAERTHIKLPEAFCTRMQNLLGAEWKEFLSSYDNNRYYGLRMNPLKTSSKEFLERMPYTLEKVSWAWEGFYYREEEQPGREILHEIGAYYIQEPSAMAVVEILDPRPGERVLDLCAAPGGKCTQIAGRMNGEGLLVANEVILNRARILSQNVERMGIKNCVVCNELPERMSKFFPGYFDKIVVDAPCSGEGMFRKDETAIEQWSVEHVRMCADRQDTILDEAAKMLKPGGVLVYSTCTFEPDENEGAVSRFVREHEDFMIEETVHDAAFAPGRADWIENPVPGLEYTMRLWPHRIKGEGHYIARLRRMGASMIKNKRGKNDVRSRTAKREEALQNFLSKELGVVPGWLEAQRSVVQSFGEQVYLVPEEMVSMQGMKVIRPGLHLVTEKKNRLEPSHSFALALKTAETDKVMEVPYEDAARYLHGESIPCGSQKGWTLLCFQGYPLGFGKAAGGQMKNHYPKGLRK